MKSAMCNGLNLIKQAQLSLESNLNTNIYCQNLHKLKVFIFKKA